VRSRRKTRYPSVACCSQIAHGASRSVVRSATVRGMAFSAEQAKCLRRARGLAPEALGLGLRVPHYEYVLEHAPQVDYFEVISENFFGPAPMPRARLERVRARYPVVLHGVGLNLLGCAPLDDRYLDSLSRLADAVDAPFVSDHLCWTGAHGVSHTIYCPRRTSRNWVELAASVRTRCSADLAGPLPSRTCRAMSSSARPP